MIQEKTERIQKSISQTNQFMKRLPHTALPVLAAAILCLTASCSKESPSAGAPVVQEGTAVHVAFNATQPSVRQYVSGEGDGVGSLDLLVFRASDGLLAARERVTGEEEIGASVTAGMTMDWYIIANAPEGTFSSFTDETTFLSALTPLTQTSASTMVMHAEGTTAFTASTGTVEAPLSRYASKVTVNDVSVPWLDSFATAPSCSVERVGLINVVGTAPWSGTPATGSVWYNRSGFDGTLSAALRSMLLWDDGVTVTAGEAATVGESFFAMPNPITGGDYGTPWSERGTRVALELLVGGQANWYMIDLPAMEGNRHYVLNEVVILGPGATAPDLPLDRSSVTFGIEILDWGSDTKNAEFGT